MTLLILISGILTTIYMAREILGDAIGRLLSEDDEKPLTNRQ